ncbi:hypothetical protein [Knoellia sp. LjRoot47]|uniref:hypothetical protein n=1 Tax=Knoellia sp. LjRoot47 TaxID=3342330 RepID=UPI003F509F3A
MGAAYTPETWDAWTAKLKADHGNGNGHGKSLAIEAQRLLPTPVSDNSRGLPSASTDYASLANEAARLFPTPRATDGTKGGPNQRGSSGDLMLPSAVHLLPTPTTTQRGTDANLDTREGARANLHNEVAKLLPTPTTGNRTSEKAKTGRDTSGPSRGGPSIGLEDVAADQDWREYAAAIARAEHATGRTAPPPTEPGTKGNPRLSPAFVEWLMMLPAGHVTDPAIGLTRNEQLKALGNGVVPPQAAAATRAFIADTIAERGAA